MGIITLWNVNFFSKGKEPYESTLVFAQKWEMTLVIPLFTPRRHIILLKMRLYYLGPSNIKYLVPPLALINPFILSILIRKGFTPIKSFVWNVIN